MLRTLQRVLILQSVLPATSSGGGEKRVWGTVNICCNVDKCLVTSLVRSTSVSSSKSLWTLNKYQCTLAELRVLCQDLDLSCLHEQQRWRFSSLQPLLLTGRSFFLAVSCVPNEAGNTGFRVTSESSGFCEALNLPCDSSCAVGLTALLLHLATVTPCNIIPLVKFTLNWHCCCHWWNCSWNNYASNFSAAGRSCNWFVEALCIYFLFFFFFFIR